MAGEVFEGTALIPDVIADGVVEEACAALAADGSEAAIGALTRLGPGARAAMSDRLVEMADDAYASDPAVRGAMSGCDGRGALWAIMRPWAAAEVAEVAGTDLLSATPAGFEVLG